MDKLFYKEYYRLEREHWWFKARLEILRNVTNELTSEFEGKSKILNAGAATGATSIMLKKFGDVLSLEHDKDCAEFLSKVLDEEVLNNSLTDLSLDEKSFDIVCAFDVIEHIDDHEKAVREINRVLKNGGYIFITVPAFNILWSHHDIINHHFRRYRLEELERILIKNGFQIKYSTYFNFFLFPPILILRLFSKLFTKKTSNESTGSDFEKFNSLIINKILYKLFLSESALLRLKIKMPFGVSAMIIGKKAFKVS
jgi:SAM-dependent methyltransferase